ncbi:MAG: RluA family pseudouridine synthase [Firmicutes bacterium]|nr:RluA family pseudouridine synthase [Bacillota bacterium]
MKHIFTVQKPNQKLTGFLYQELGFLPLTLIRNQIRLGEVRVNGEKTVKDRPLQMGDEVKIFLPDKYSEKGIGIRAQGTGIGDMRHPLPVPCALCPDTLCPNPEPRTPNPEPRIPSPQSRAPSQPFEVAYADENIVAAVKPAFCETETHFTDMVCTRFPSAVPVHRLDRNTRGLVLFALNESAKAELLNMFKTRKIEKHYRAVVFGCPQKPSADITVYLKKDAAKAKVFVSDTKKPGYLTAKMSYAVAGRDGDDTVLDIVLHTGRTHQIRATLAHLGHPVIGDGKYGSEKLNRARHTKIQRLLAYKIRFLMQPANSGVLCYLAGKTIALNKTL